MWPTYIRASDPAVLRLIQSTIRQSNQAGVPVNLCGEMSTSPKYVPLLLGLGLRSLSVPPSSVPEIKQVCRSVSIEQCEAIAKRVMELESAFEVDGYLTDQLRQIFPELAI